jgi:2-methylisocitrate lyase-like PEP mutase family enzyme
VKATSLPVNADFQEGFARTPDDLFENAKLCVATGVAGLSIEDATGKQNHPLFERQEAIDRIRAARAAIDATGIPVLLTGRCEAWLAGDTNPFRTAIDRLVAFADAGADCLFAPGVNDPQQIRDIVNAVHPKPVNVIIPSFIPGLTLSTLEDLGVRRISVGSALSRVAWKAFMDVARSIKETGTFNELSRAASFADVNGVFEGRKT